MKLTLLGTGIPAPTAERQGSANLVEIGEQVLLVDAGRGATTQLARVGLAPAVVDQVFITHHHFDHMSCLDDLLLSAWNGGRSDPIAVFGPPGTADIVETLLYQVYRRDIEYRLFEAERLGFVVPDLRALVVTRDLAAGEVVEGPGWSVRADLVEHGHSLGLTHEEWPCLGYRVEAEGSVVVFSGDAVACDALDRLAEGADVLVHCCYLADVELDTHQRRMLADHVLAGSVQAGGTAARAHVKKLVLTHLAPKSPDALAAIEHDVRRSYTGDMVIGEDLLSIEV